MFIVNNGVIRFRSVLFTMSLPPGFTPKAIRLRYLTLNDAAKFEYKCKDCNRCIVQKKNSEWTTLLNHIKSQHPEYIELCNDNTQSTLRGMFTTGKMVTKKSKNIFSWTNWICCTLKPFSFVEDKLNREYTNLVPISVNALKKYMELLTKRVESKVKENLPDKFALVIDGWSQSSLHYVAVFASYGSSTLTGYSTVLLSFSPMFSEISFVATDHYEFLEWILSLYSKSFENVVASLAILYPQSTCQYLQ